MVCFATLPEMVSRLGWGVRGLNPLLKYRGQPRKIPDGSLKSVRMDINLNRHGAEEKILYLASILTNCASGGSPSNTPFRKIWEVKEGLNHTGCFILLSF